MRNFICLVIICFIALVMGCSEREDSQKTASEGQINQKGIQNTRADVSEVNSDSSRNASDTATGNGFASRPATDSVNASSKESETAPSPFRTPAWLAKEFENAVSIEVRFKTKKDYDDAVVFYKSRITGKPITDSYESVEYASSGSTVSSQKIQ
ncbi:hypothetical protein [Hymenobacter glacialis]|uniref:hypothetical protein n=1 Tax=Hymenobacter glacialis TaxID=1908236 RepID=UPI000F7B4C20|nr:hypothetical protein [Hymenobacter glacialis]